MKKIMCVVGLFVVVGMIQMVSVAAEQNNKCPSVSCFMASYSIEGLKPLHDYVLAINGYGDHQSNRVLLGIGELWRPSGEGYCDFAHVSTDENGVLNVSVAKALPAGSYKIKFLVKDPGDDWKVVWNKDDLEFTVAGD